MSQVLRFSQRGAEERRRDGRVESKLEPSQVPVPTLRSHQGSSASHEGGRQWEESNLTLWVHTHTHTQKGEGGRGDALRRGPNTSDETETGYLTRCRGGSFEFRTSALSPGLLRGLIRMPGF